MKKSVIILIGIIYLASIFVVGLFGGKQGAFDEVVYITNIDCTNEGIAEVGKNHKEIVFDYDPDKSIEENALIITYKVYPSESTLKGADAVEVYAIPNDKLFTQDGVVFKFHAEYGMVTIYLNSLDGSSVQEIIDVYVI